MDEINLGAYSIPVILVTVLALVYRLAGDKINDKWKPVIAVGIGIALGLAGIFYQGVQLTFPNVIDFTLYGFFAGCSAVGIYEVQRTVTKPRG